MHPHQPSRLVGLSELFDVQMLWFSDWYDGPVTGLTMHERHEYWFVMVANGGGETWDFEPRVNVLHELTPGELATEWEQHRSFSALGIPGLFARAAMSGQQHEQRGGTRGAVRAVASGQ